MELPKLKDDLLPTADGLQLILDVVDPAVVPEFDKWWPEIAHRCNVYPDLLAVCKKGPAPNVFAQFADFAEECMTKPSMAVYKGHFSGLAVFLRSCVSRSEESLQALAKAEKE